MGHVMAPNRIFTDALDACLKPRLVELESNLIAASFDLMKLIPAKFILDQAKIMAKTNGHETPRPIIEISSGLFGLALAIACCVKGHRLTLVCGSDVNQALVARMTGLGAEIEKLEAPSFSPDFSRTSADFIEEARANNPGAFYPSHNNNPQNPGSYSSLAELLLEAIGNVDCLIGPVETGGSLRGTGTYMRLVKPELHIVAVDSLNSVLFGRRAGPLFVPGLGNACMPMNLDHSVFDEVHWVSDGEALCAARTLERDLAAEGLLADLGHRPGRTRLRRAHRRRRLLTLLGTRSEERRVGKECRSRWSPYH